MDPKSSAAIERMLTVFVTYFVTKYAKMIPGLDASMVPDIVILVLALGSAGIGVIKNTKLAILKRAEQIPEVHKIELNGGPDTPALNQGTSDKVVVKKESKDA